MADNHDAAHYRQRAADMRAQADRADTDQLRASYLAIAADWLAMAEDIEQARFFDVAACVPEGARPRGHGAAM